MMHSKHGTGHMGKQKKQAQSLRSGTYKRRKGRKDASGGYNAVGGGMSAGAGGGG